MAYFLCKFSFSNERYGIGGSSLCNEKDEMIHITSLENWKHEYSIPLLKEIERPAYSISPYPEDCFDKYVGGMSGCKHFKYCMPDRDCLGFRIYKTIESFYCSEYWEQLNMLGEKGELNAAEEKQWVIGGRIKNMTNKEPICEIKMFAEGYL